MSVQMKTETIIDLKQAPPYLGPGRNGRPVHYSFLVRAIKKGINGHRLEALKIGNRWITSVEALQRWAERQTADAAGQSLARSPTQRATDNERADRRLKELGM